MKMVMHGRRARHPLVVRVLLALLGGAGVAVLVSYWAVRHYQLPAPTGPFAVGTRILNLTDAARREELSGDPAAKRELVVQVWYPAEDSANPIAQYKRWHETLPSTFYEALISTHSRVDAPIAHSGEPYPVLLYGNRWNGERTQNTELAEELASHGYVVVAVDRPYNSSRVLMADGQVIEGKQDMRGPRGDAATAAEQIDFWNRSLEVWAADDLFVLTWLVSLNADASAWPQGRLDTKNVGALGHSFGGAVAFRLCGMDARVKAAVNLDGWTFGALKQRTAAQTVMIFDEGSARDRRKELKQLPFPGSVDDQMDRADFAAVDSGLAKAGGYRMYVAGTQHMDFTDQPMLPPLHRGSFTGPIAAGAVDAILRQTVLAFFDQSLRGKRSALLEPGQKTFPELTVETWPGR
ncbi:MAG: dienelactone hydrolase family protein [Acidobacteriota bacterium]